MSSEYICIYLSIYISVYKCREGEREPNTERRDRHLGSTGKRYCTFWTFHAENRNIFKTYYSSPNSTKKYICYLLFLHSFNNCRRESLSKRVLTAVNRFATEPNSHSTWRGPVPSYYDSDPFGQYVNVCISGALIGWRGVF